jgi:hypothetical protein
MLATPFLSFGIRHVVLGYRLLGVVVDYHYFSPFFSSKLLDLPILIVGAAGFGCGIICPCKTKVKNRLDSIYIVFFMMVLLFFGFV